MPPEERDSFANLLLLCLAHHGEVDGDEERYPPHVLKRWKESHEGVQNAVLNRVSVPDPDYLMQVLSKIAEPPLNRLEAITERLEKTGEVTAETVHELKQVIEIMSDPGAGINARTAQLLSSAAEVFGTSSFGRSARELSDAADVLPGVVRSLNSAASRLEDFR